MLAEAKLRTIIDRIWRAVKGGEQSSDQQSKDAQKPTLSTVRGGLQTPAGQRKVVHLGTVVDDDLDVPTWQRKRQSESAPEAKPAAEGKDKYDIPAFLRKQAN